ncbi:hypothetical protein MPC4_170031 [Methylocella tundrae]|uniref:Uncharacterized protein n=1 Tax=Methylocella tundrae TaxID=227605 RepID=A0A8B6M594_METTU|nr:hypothetical protein MPC4_170031 [Methylocella tundrae]
MERGLLGAYFSVGVRGILSEASSDQDQFSAQAAKHRRFAPCDAARQGPLPPELRLGRSKRLIIGTIGPGYLFDLHKRLDALLVN